MIGTIVAAAGFRLSPIRAIYLGDGIDRIAGFHAEDAGAPATP
jgi:hypothetical protein